MEIVFEPGLEVGKRSVRSSSRSGWILADKRFLVHPGLKIMLCVITLL